MAVMRASWAIVVMVSACKFNPPLVDDGVHDAGPDSNILQDTSSPEAGCTSFASKADTCTETFGGALNLDVTDAIYTYDTGTGIIVAEDDNGNSLGSITPTPRKTVNGIDMIFVSSFALGSTNTLHLIGSKPFGIIARDVITIDGDITVEAGSRTATSCGSQAGIVGDSSGGGGGGGGGGGYSTGGQKGGDGSANGRNGGGSVGLSLVLGGCPGARGGTGAGSGGTGGAAGGGLYLAAGMSITITSTSDIDAGGKGGSGGPGSMNNNSPGLSGGGGGGGSGGLLWFESSSIAIRGKLFANGGGGGEGAGAGGGSQGGDDGRPGTQSTTGAPGGMGEPEGGNGGTGGAIAPPTAGSNGNSGGGGGGGGGGAGYIRLTTPSSDIAGSTISPAAIP